MTRAIEALPATLFLEGHGKASTKVKPPRQIVLDPEATDDRCTGIRKAERTARPDGSSVQACTSKTSSIASRSSTAEREATSYSMG